MRSPSQNHPTAAFAFIRESKVRESHRVCCFSLLPC